ncbi:MAG: NAD(P)H-binding protein [Proteobacteria bacterium]|nr:NAD(P)H-binding protein [Pseudomonadota bacterium]MDA1301248.1 NAD(P)H-binding protein [Pseudomonadota bacterium]
MSRLLITGANGHLGTRLIREAARQHELVAIVRSGRAREQLVAATNGLPVDIRVVDYTDEASLVGAATGCRTAIHLVGIIKRPRGTAYADAHENPCRALANAAASAGVSSIVYLSLIGSDRSSSNECFSSRGRAEDILRAGTVPATIIRVPMVLGAGDYAAWSLSRKARSAIVLAFRAASLEQPIAAGDVVTAILHAMAGREHRIVELAGPESLSRRELIARAGHVYGRSPWVISLPIGLALFMAGMLERLLANPPVTRDMLGILDHDDNLDSEAGARLLDVELTSLDDMLRSALPGDQLSRSNPDLPG